jgi:hypothetical protein
MLSGGDATPGRSSRRFGYAAISASVTGGQSAGLVVLGAEAGRADCRDHCEKLLEGHVEIQKTALAEDPSVVIEDFIGDHHGEAWKGRDRGKAPRSFDARQFDYRRVPETLSESGLSGDTVVRTVALIPERNHFTSGASRHE